MAKLILASSSPRRLQLLRVIGYVPDAIASPDIDESVKPKERVTAYVKRLAREKALTIAADYPQDVVLAGDTTVVLGNRIIGKPADEEEARKIIARLSGRHHKVYTAIAVAYQGRIKIRVVKTSVKVKKIAPQELAFYLASQQWEGKAGAYMINGIFGAFIKNINGSSSSVVGLPIMETNNLLVSCGLSPRLENIES